MIRTRTAFAPLPGFLCDYAGIILAPSAYDGQGQPQRQIATGPYRVTAVSGARGIEAEAFPGHRGAAPAIPRLGYTAVVLGDTRASMAEAGEADLVFTLLPQPAERIEAAGRGHIIRTTIPRPRMIDMNLKPPQFADIRVRRAMSLTIDREGIANAILHDKPGVATQLLPPVLAGWYDPSLPPLHRDVAEAKRLLAEAGWTAGADSTLAKGGQKLQASMMVPSNRPEIPLMAQAVQAQLRAVGIAIEVLPGPSGALPGGMRDGSMQTAMLARTYVNMSDPIGTILPDFTGTQQVWASPGFVNAGMERSVQAYLVSFDDTERASLRKRIVAILQDQLPVIPVSRYELNRFVSPRVALASVVLHPFEQDYGAPAIKWA